VTPTAHVEPATASPVERWASVGAGAIGAGWIVAAAVTYRPEGGWLPVGCPVHRLTGLDCPGCGSTRSLGALARLDPVAAFDHNVLVPFALVLVVASWARWARSKWAGTDAAALVSGPVAVSTIGVVLLGFAVLRNLEVAAWLASDLASLP
jgi:hypothetical protein